MLINQYKYGFYSNKKKGTGFNKLVLKQEYQLKDDDVFIDRTATRASNSHISYK